MTNCYYKGAQVLPMAKLTQKSCLGEFMLCVEPCTVVRQSSVSAAYDKIDLKELFRRLKKGGL